MYELFAMELTGCTGLYESLRVMANEYNNEQVISEGIDTSTIKY